MQSYDLCYVWLIEAGLLIALSLNMVVGVGVGEINLFVLSLCW